MNKIANRPSQRAADEGSLHGAVPKKLGAGGSELGLDEPRCAGRDELSTAELALQASRAGGRLTQSPIAACPITVSIASRDAGFVERMGIEMARQGDMCLLEPRWNTGGSRIANLMPVAQAHVLVVDADIVASVADKPEFHLWYGSGLSNLILVSDEDSPAVVDVVLATRARGCITTGSDADLFARAVRAVALGDLWLPRWIMAALHLRATNASVKRPESRRNDPGGDHLSPRETNVMALARTGLTNKQIGWQLNISASTVKKHLSAALVKCGLHRRRQLLP